MATIVSFDAVERYGVKAEGDAAGASASVLAELAELVAAGRLEVPLAATFRLTQVRDAYRRLAQGHIRGKIVPPCALSAPLPPRSPADARLLQAMTSDRVHGRRIALVMSWSKYR